MQEAAVVGLPDARWGSVVVAFIVRDAPGLTADAIDAFCRASADLASYKRPRRIVFVDSLPTNPSGKVLKRELVAEYGPATAHPEPADHERASDDDASDNGAGECSGSEHVVGLIRALAFEALPLDVVTQAQRCLLDLVGVAAGGSARRRQPLSTVTSYRRWRVATLARAAAGRAACKRGGRAFAGAATIDALDGHDGDVLTKGHAGVAVLPALLAVDR